MPTECAIAFENSSKVFYTGESVRGTIRLTITNETVIEKARIKFDGVGYVSYNEEVQGQRYDSTQKRYVTTTHTETRYRGGIYVDETLHFMNSDYVRLTPGVYNYPFETVLPLDIPSSIRATHGKITYKVCVTFDDNKKERKFEEPFIVTKSVNLNYNPRLRQPVTANKVKTFYPCCLFFCCESDPLEVTARIPVGGYARGQTIDLNISVSNESNVAVERFDADLEQVLTCNGRSSKDKRIIASATTEGCDKLQNKDHRARILVPSVPPTDDGDFKLIEIQYRLRVSGAVGSCHKDFCVDLPVAIGVYPFRDV